MQLSGEWEGFEAHLEQAFTESIVLPFKQEPSQPINSPAATAAEQAFRLAHNPRTFP